jgi:hypothetical protein
MGRCRSSRVMFAVTVIGSVRFTAINTTGRAFSCFCAQCSQMALATFNASGDCRAETCALSEDLTEVALSNSITLLELSHPNLMVEKPSLIPRVFVDNISVYALTPLVEVDSRVPFNSVLNVQPCLACINLPNGLNVEITKDSAKKKL